ncbi:class I SAM-dependent methyltransferase [Nocardia sp. NPDC051321]|uniref:class I SAM-dependent methyltransferase n=1 Tax=Nocardia sp. NPDC051321 TaxID=3364323 RepID=UPI003791BA71
MSTLPQLAESETDQERVRLERVAALTDPATIRHLEHIGVTQGWRCAEVGAGTGSIARWLADRVGDHGKVVAVDIETEFMAGISAPNLEIRKQDITTTALEAGGYDLVHVKILLMHLDERERILGELVAALAPGGFLLLEEADIRSIQRVDPPSPLLTRAASALESFFYFGGADPGFGMKLLPAVRRTGLKVLGTDCQLTAIQAGTPDIQSITLSLAKLAPMIVKAGLMGQNEVDAAFELLEQPSDTVIYTPITVSVWAQRTND